MDLAGDLRLPHPVDRMSGIDLRRMLAGPLPSLDAQALLRCWHWATVAILIEGRFDGLEGHDVARKIRGALWPILRAAASSEALAGRACPRRPACLLDLLWNEHGRVTRAREIPKPWVLRAAIADRLPSGNGMAVVQLVLFGAATSWANEVHDALASTLRAGVARGGWRMRQTEVLDEVGMEPGPQSDTIRIEFVSPLKMTRDGRPAGDFDGFLSGIVDRVDGLAIWHGLDLECEFARIKNLAHNTCLERVHLDVGSWQRRSARQTAPIPMVDLRGSILLSNLAPELYPFLAIGALTHAGKDTRHGHGWYRISPA